MKHNKPLFIKIKQNECGNCRSVGSFRYIKNRFGAIESIYCSNCKTKYLIDWTGGYPRPIYYSDYSTFLVSKFEK